MRCSWWVGKGGEGQDTRQAVAGGCAAYGGWGKGRRGGGWRWRGRGWGGVGRWGGGGRCGGGGEGGGGAGGGAGGGGGMGGLGGVGEGEEGQDTRQAAAGGCAAHGGWVHEWRGKIR